MNPFRNLPQTIHFYEELSNRAWPCLEALEFGNWELRFSRGYTNRANSVSTYRKPGIPVPRMVESCEKEYTSRELRTVFKINQVSCPTSLDSYLEGRGYETIIRSAVLKLELSGRRFSSPPGFRVSREFEEPWLEAFWRLSEKVGGHQEIFRELVARIPGKNCFLVLERDGKVLACGRGVLEGRFLGLFDIVVSAKHRGQGHGLGLMEALLNWGVEQGAREAYLQVEIENLPALALYRKLGFEELYQYWYRRK